MSRADGGLRKELRKRLPKSSGWHWTAIETGGTLQGVPDIFFANQDARVSGWIECKHTDGWQVTLEPHQVAWLTLHATCGVRCFIFVKQTGRGRDGIERDDLWILRASKAVELLHVGLRGAKEVDALIAKYEGGPRRWDWSAIAQLLRRS